MDVKMVTAAKPKTGGAAFCAPVGTALPTDATTALVAAFLNLGYISEDGITNANSPTSDKVKAWGGDTVLDFQDGKEDKFKTTFIEGLNINVLKTIYGDANVTGDLEKGIKIVVNNKDNAHHVWVVDMILKNAVKRIVIPDGCITELSEITYKSNGAVGYGATISAYPDTSGNTHYEYIVGTSGTAETKE